MTHKEPNSRDRLEACPPRECPRASGRGLPIGSLTSQHLANFYLGPLDRFCQAHPAVNSRHSSCQCAHTDSGWESWKDSGRRPSGSNRVNRGGSWNNNANNCRSANRNRNNPDNRNNNLGFRVALAQVKAGWPQRTEPAAVPSPQRVVAGQSARERGPVLVAEQVSAKAPGLAPAPSARRFRGAANAIALFPTRATVAIFWWSAGHSCPPGAAGWGAGSGQECPRSYKRP